jgi:hypothetical protein
VSTAVTTAVETIVGSRPARAGLAPDRDSLSGIRNPFLDRAVVAVERWRPL